MKKRNRRRVIIVTPYLADSNNGNWRTAHRWASFLAPTYEAILQSDWQGEPCDLLIALHARRSHASLARFRSAHPDAPSLLVLTGTDLYKDLPADKQAALSVELANALVVLQEDAIQHIPLQHRHKTRVIFQSARSLVPAVKPPGRLDCVAVGHLRPEKDPLTLLAALDHLAPGLPIHVLHIGQALDTSLGAAVAVRSASDTRYHWSDAMPHGLTRAAIKRAHVLIHPSRMEGGANVVVEALTSGTPVLASRMSGNVGMLGKDYPGYFEVGDARGLAQLMTQCCTDRNFYSRLNNAAKARTALFSPAEEQRRLLLSVSALLSD